jgi:hypothetical protein
MRMPRAEAFRQEDGDREGPPWWADVDGDDVTLTVPDREGAPHPSSLAMAERVLAELPALLAEGAAHILRLVHAPHAGGVGGETVASRLHVEAHTRTARLYLYWEVNVHALWYVIFQYHPSLPRAITGFGRMPFAAREHVPRGP